MQLKLRLANEDDRPLMRLLLSECFSLGDEYIDNFFANVLPVSYCIVAEYYHKPVAALYLIPALIGEDRAFYIYGAAVMPKYRGLGIMTRILNILYAWGENHQCWMFAKSGNRNTLRACLHNKMELALFYKFLVSHEAHPAPHGVRMTVRDISDDEYLKERGDFNGGRLFVRWIDRFMLMGLDDFRKSGGRVVRISYGYARFAALLQTVYRGVILCEALACEDDVRSVLPVLQYRYKALSASAFVFSADMTDKRFCGFAKGYGDKKFRYFIH